LLLIDELLKSFKIKSMKPSENDYLVINTVLKLFNDIYSISQHSYNIFYQSDFHVIIDIIIRKLSNLSSDDQVFDIHHLNKAYYFYFNPSFNFRFEWIIFH
jgi:hypothetical protein